MGRVVEWFRQIPDGTSMPALVVKLVLFGFLAVGVVQFCVLVATKHWLGFGWTFAVFCVTGILSAVIVGLPPSREPKQ